MLIMRNQNTKMAIFGANGYVAKNLRRLHFSKIDFVSISRRDFKSYDHENKIRIFNLNNQIPDNLQNW